MKNPDEKITEAAKNKATHLDLSGSGLNKDPPELASLTNLTTLILARNQLTAIPPELASLTNLTKLDLADNQLTAIPPELASLTNLRKLSLAGNQLTAIPPELASLTNLTKLYLAGNQLTAIPPELASLTNLTVAEPRWQSSYDSSARNRRPRDEGDPLLFKPTGSIGATRMGLQIVAGRRGRGGKDMLVATTAGRGFPGGRIDDTRD